MDFVMKQALGGKCHHTHVLEPRDMHDFLFNSIKRVSKISIVNVSYCQNAAFFWLVNVFCV